MFVGVYVDIICYLFADVYVYMWKQKQKMKPKIEYINENERMNEWTVQQTNKTKIE